MWQDSATRNRHIGECPARNETLGSIVERTKPAFEVAATRISRKHVPHESGMEGHNKALQICGKCVGGISCQILSLQMTNTRVTGFY
jgi:hypothetical protein